MGRRGYMWFRQWKRFDGREDDKEGSDGESICGSDEAVVVNGDRGMGGSGDGMDGLDGTMVDVTEYTEGGRGIFAS
jgi:hypothetical protein